MRIVIEGGIPMQATLLITLAQTDRSWSDRLVPWLIVAGLLIVAAVIGYANYQNAKPFRIESSSSLRPKETLDTLQSTFASDGWQLGYRDSGSLMMSIDSNASLPSAVALGCLSVWFALLYLITGKKRITVEIDVTESIDGSLIVTNGSRSGSYLRYVSHHLNELPKMSQSTMSS